MAMILTKDNFQQEVLQASQPVLVDFWAPWCGPCMALAPVIDEISREHPELKIGKINVDDELELAKQYRVMSIPTLMVFNNGEITRRAVGGQSKEKILEMME